MKFSCSSGFLAIISAALLSACGGTTSNSLLDGEGDTVRIHATFISFTKYKDTVQMDVGLSFKDGACRFVDPLMDDASTRWKPTQTYWVVRDKPSDVDHSELRNMFFEGDVVTRDQFSGSLGFQYLTDFHAQNFPLQSMNVNPGKTEMSGQIGSPFNAVLRMNAVTTQAGGGTACTAQTFYCKTGWTCDNPASFRKLTSIYVKQNFLGIPTGVTFNE